MDQIESEVGVLEPSESMPPQARTRFEILNAVVSHPSLRPLAGHVFRLLWIATIASNLGTWMQDVGESWLMVSFTRSPISVALIETCGSLPIVLLALPAGALADIVDRRRLLLATQTWMLVVAALMCSATAFDNA